LIVNREHLIYRAVSNSSDGILAVNHYLVISLCIDYISSLGRAAFSLRT